MHLQLVLLSKQAQIFKYHYKSQSTLSLGIEIWILMFDMGFLTPRRFSFSKFGARNTY